MADETAGRASTRAPTLLKFPGEQPILHDAVKWWESTKTKIATAQLSKTANGLVSDAASRIIDTNLAETPLLDPNHRDYERRLQFRMEHRKRNKINRIERNRIIMAERSAVFSAIYESCEETAPMFARELREACDYALDGVEGGHFDGTLAWRMAYNKLFPAVRTRADTDFYDTAKDLQKKSTLSDGCKASEFMAKAYAWIYKIRPHLAQPYDDAAAAEYIVRLMPKRLGADARRIKAEVDAAGKGNDLMHLARQLEAIVYDDQASPPPAPVLVALDPQIAGRFELMALSEMTGLAFAAVRPSGRPPRDPRDPGRDPADRAGVTLLFGAGGKWCNRCPHGADGKGTCFPSAFFRPFLFAEAPEGCTPSGSLARAWYRPRGSLAVLGRCILSAGTTLERFQSFFGCRRHCRRVVRVQLFFSQST